MPPTATLDNCPRRRPMRHRRRSGTRFLTFHEWAAQGRPPQLGALAHPTDDVGVRRPGLGLSGGSNVADAAPDRLPLRALLLLSAAFLAVQVVLTDYGDGHVGAAGLWVRGWVPAAAGRVSQVQSCRVRRGGGDCLRRCSHLRPRHPPESPAVFLALTYLGQAVPLLLRPVREHVTIRC